MVDTSPKGTLFFGASADEIHKNSSNANTALKALGIKVSDHISYRGSICFIAKKGEPNYLKVASNQKNEGPTKLIVTVRGKIRGKYFYVKQTITQYALEMAECSTSWEQAYVEDCSLVFRHLFTVLFHKDFFRMQCSILQCYGFSNNNNNKNPHF